jgi:hypothetical protein
MKDRFTPGWDDGQIHKFVLAGPWDAPGCAALQGGFVRFLFEHAVSANEMALLGTDGRVTVFQTFSVSGNPAEARGSCNTTARSNYVGGTVSDLPTGTSDYFQNLRALLRRDGRVDLYNAQLALVVPAKGTYYDPDRSEEWIEGPPVRLTLFAPKLPKGLKYVDVAGQGTSVMAYLRSDGKILYQGAGLDLIPVKKQLPVLPKGMKYVSLTSWFDSWIVMRSDGQATVLNGGYTVHQQGQQPNKVRPQRQLPRLAKGWRYVSGAIPRDKETVFLVEKITSGMKVATGIEKIKTPKSVVKGKTAKITVKVASRAVLDGGTVKVTYKNKTIGKAKVKGTKAVIKLKTAAMVSRGQNTIGVQYLGKGQGKKSTKARTVIVTR